jgi:cysteine protease ATG4
MESITINRQKIIEKCIDKSYETRKKISMSVVGWKNRFLNLKDSFKYNLVNLNTKFVPDSKSIHLLYKIYNPSEPSGLKLFNEALNKLLLITYRSNYKEQKNVKNNSIYTSDCGWGCMIRSSQMIFTRMIYQIFEYIYTSEPPEKIIKAIIPFFMDNNLFMSEINIKSSEFTMIGMDSYILQLKKYLEKKIIENQYKQLEIKSFDPPFSIHKICTIGEIYGRTCGEWFSDFELPKIYEIINSTFNIIPNLSILHFNSDIDMDTVLENCFEKVEGKISDEDKKKFFTNENNENFCFKKMGAIFVSMRLGVSYISEEYFPSIKKLFDCKQFLGLIGGKFHSASYFFGFCGDDLLYLDPHFNQESCYNLSDKTFMSYMNKTIYKLSLKSLQSAFTVGFLFRDLNEFRDLYIFFKSYLLEKVPCFHVRFVPYKEERHLSDKEIANIFNDEDDF